jgi:anti-anti-sigma factor
VSHPSFDLEVTRNASSARIAPAGELDIATAPELERAIAEVTGDSARLDLVVDLRGLTFMDSTGLRTLVQTNAQAAQDGFTLSIVRGPSQIDRLFAVSGLDDVLPLVDAPPTDE